MSFILVSTVLMIALDRLDTMFSRMKTYNFEFVIFTVASTPLCLCMHLQPVTT